jgi:hypothetical protein
LWNVLEAVRSRHRQLAGAPTPYVYVKEDVTGMLNKLVFENGTATSGAAATLTDSGKSWTTNAFAGYKVELLTGTGAGQVRTVVSNTGTVLTVTPNWSTNPAAATTYSVQGRTNDWFKSRVLEVSRRPVSGGLVRFEETALRFAIEDTTWNNLG